MLEETAAEGENRLDEGTAPLPLYMIFVTSSST
jgi:hypothetical protein